MAAPTESDENKETHTACCNLGKLRNGVRMPGSAYYRPFLQVINNMGGSGKVADVLDRVGQILKPVLNKVDTTRRPAARNPWATHAGATRRSGRARG